MEETLISIEYSGRVSLIRESLSNTWRNGIHMKESGATEGKQVQRPQGGNVLDLFI